MRRYDGIGLAAGVLLACSAAMSSARAQAPAAPPAGSLAAVRNEVRDLKLELLRAEAEAAELEDEDRLLTPALQPGGEADVRFVSADSTLWDEATDKGMQDGKLPDGLRTSLESLQEKSEKNAEAAVDAWRSEINHSFDVEDDRAKAERMIGWSWNQKTPDVGATLAVLGLGIFAVLGGLLLTAHEVRDRLRWRFRAKGSRPSLIAVALAVSLAAAVGASPGTGGDDGNPPAAADPDEEPIQTVESLGRDRNELLEKRARLQEANTTARQRVAGKLEAIRKARASHGLKPDEAHRSLVRGAEAIEADLQDRFQKIRILARITAGAAEKAQKLQEKSKDASTHLDAFVLASRNAVRGISLVQVAACLLFILTAIVPLMRVRRRRRRELDEQSRKCPRCGWLDTLEVVTAPEADDDRQAAFHLMVCNRCEYEIRENYVRQNRLCFPTVGIRASGKTHWLAMMYEQIKNANIPVASAIRKIPSREDAAFDQLVRELYYSGQGPAPSVLGLPYPLTFHVHDADPLGANNSMVNLFDFTGELRNFTIDQNEFRRRALRCEGFTLFLDPTQVSKGSNLTIEDQVQTLSQFAEEMHAIRGLASEEPIDLPIAICVSKIDLLVTKSPMGTQAIELVTHLRKTLTQKVDLSLIHERSQLCARAMPLMFPGWNVERMLRENFGGRYMFFPMSAVGIDESELGVEDLSERLITPFGMIEPLLWLLHMHGYCVFH